MTGRYKAYAEYKESNYEWLGEVPRHWDVAYSKWLFSERNNKANQSDEMLTASQKYGVIPQKLFMKLEQQKVVQVQKGHDILKQVKKNDFVISMRSFQGGIEFCDYDGAVSSAYVPLEPKEDLSLSYFKYLFKSKPYIQALQATTNLVRDGQALRYNNFLQVKIPVPEQGEAEKIGTFLNYETAKIDTLISKQEKLIELLKEKRQAVISHAVTKGLNPDAPMKDSGVEWLGEVPDHWDVCAIKRELSSLDYRRIPLSADERGKRSGGYRYYGASGVIDYIDDYIFDEPTVLVGEDGANLVNRSTPLAFAAYGQYWVNNHAHILSPKDGLAEYWAEVIEIIDVTPLISGSAQPKLTAEALGNLKIAFSPLLEERETINSFIRSQKTTFDSLIGKAQQQVKLLKERKTALISAAVIGKIDVRDWDAQGVQG